MQYIYRIENAEGKGPYGSDHSPIADILVEAHQDMSTHPAIYWDIEGNFKEFQCGFESMEKLNAWFTPKQIEMCEECGFHIRKIAVKEYKNSRSRKQIFFKTLDIIEKYPVS